MLTYLALGDEKRDVGKRSGLQVVVVIGIAKLDTDIFGPATEKEQGIEHFQFRGGAAQAEIVTFPGDVVGIQQVYNQRPAQAAMRNRIRGIPARGASPEVEAIGNSWPQQ